MTGPNVAGGGEREENTASPPTSAWCTSTSVGSTMFEFTWNIADYQRKKESIKRDDSIQSSTFTIQVHPVKMENFEICNSGKQQEIAVVLDFPTKWCCPHSWRCTRPMLVDSLCFPLFLPRRRLLHLDLSCSTLSRICNHSIHAPGFRFTSSSQNVMNQIFSKCISSHFHRDDLSFFHTNCCIHNINISKVA